jgi:hypothetical protein
MKKRHIVSLTVEERAALTQLMTRVRAAPPKRQPVDVLLTGDVVPADQGVRRYGTLGSSP